MTILPLIFATGLAGVVTKATLLLLIGWCGTLALRGAPAGARHLVWLTVITGVLVLPALARVASVRVAVLPSVVATPGAGSVAATPPTATTPLVREPHPASWPNAAAPALDYGRLALDLWLGMALLRLGSLVLGMFSVRRIQRRGRVLDSPQWTRALRTAASRLDLATTPRLIMSDAVDMAFACDAITPTVVVPASAHDWSDERRQAVLLHELAHVRRRDLAGHAIARVACALYWFHPLVWVAARRLRAESERACDDLVVTNGMRATDYAQHLLDMVTSLGHARGAPTAALPLVRKSEFEGRLLAILDRAQRRTALGQAHVGALVGVLGLSAMSIGAVVPVPRAQILAAPPPRSASDVPVAPRVELASRPTHGPPISRIARAAPDHDTAAPLLIRVTGAHSSHLLKAEIVRSECSEACQQQFAEEQRSDSIRRIGLPRGGGGGAGRGGIAVTDGHGIPNSLKPGATRTDSAQRPDR